MKKALSLILALTLCLSIAACGDSETPGESGTPGSHTCSGEWVILEDATCTKAGSRQFTCSCGKVTTETIPILSHTFEDGICTGCGYADPDYKPAASIGLKFESNGNGTCYVSGLGTCTDTDIVIPEKSDRGDKVTGIKYWAFANDSITSIIIPEGVTYIGNEAFKKCDKLESVTIPASVTQIGGAAFLWCNNLTKVYITDLEAWCNIKFPVSDYGSGQPMLYGHADLYLNGQMIVDLVIPESITTLKASVFNGCNSIKTVKLHDNITAFEDYVFANCDNLVSLEIPASVTDFGDGIVSNCQKLTSITFHAEQMPTFAGYPFYDCDALQAIYVNDALASQYVALPDWEAVSDKVLQESSGKPIGPSGIYSQGLEFTSYNNGTCYVSGLGTCTDTVIRIPEASPAGDVVVEIGERAFDVTADCINITQIIVPASVTRLERNAFEGCMNLQKLDLPAGIIYGYADMLYDNINLTELTLRCTSPLSYPLDVIIRPNESFYTDVTVYVPADLVETYKATAGWSNFGDNIQAIPTETE